MRRRRKIQTNVFNFEYKKHSDNLISYKHSLNSLFHQCSKFNPHANKTFSIIKSKVQFSENFNDRNTDKKFQNLLKLKINDLSSPTVTIHNLTDKVLPENIEHIVLKGLHQPVGSRTNKNLILTKFEDFFESWRAHAKKQFLDIFKITKVRSQLYLEFDKLVNCSTKNERDELAKFLDCNTDILICHSEKTKNVNVISRESYIQKLNEVFSSDKFTRLRINPIKTDLQKLRKLIDNFEPFLTH